MGARFYKGLSFVWMMLLLSSTGVYVRNVLASEMKYVPMESKYLQRDGEPIKLQVGMRLPDGYEEVQERFPTIYFLPGNGGSAQEWLGRQDVMEAVDKRQFIAVSIPEFDNLWYSNKRDASDWAYDDFIAKELIPRVDSQFRSKPERQSRAVFGFSRGGYGAVKMALKHPDVFSMGASFAGVLDFAQQDRPDANRLFGPPKTGKWRDANDTFALCRNKAWEQASPFRLFLSCGKADTVLPSNRNLDFELTKSEIPHAFAQFDGGHCVDPESLQKAFESFFQQPQETPTATGKACEPAQQPNSSRSYCWLDAYDDSQSIAGRIAPPTGYFRIESASGSFQDWLRYLPLKAQGTPVHLYDGREKCNQSAHCAVVDIDVGEKNLQQCADAVIRLRAEYLFSIGMYEQIHFNFTSGHRADYSKWRDGYRPIVNGNMVSWSQSQKTDTSYPGFRQYLSKVFEYAGSYSLSQEMKEVSDISSMQIGDVFIQGGFPGHAVIVVDMACDPSKTGKAFMIAQSYMPAQDIHVLQNPMNPDLNPWYDLDFGETLRTPEWTFSKSDLRRF